MQDTIALYDLTNTYFELRSAPGWPRSATTWC